MANHIKNPDITKQDFLEELERQNGNCYKAYTKLGLAYSRYYKWRKEDPEFDEACEKMQQSAVKWVESKMFEMIANGNATLAKFYLNCKGGYSEKKEIKLDSNNTVDVNKTIEDIKKELKD